MICRKEFFLAGLTLCVSILSFSQTVTSVRNGSWTDPSTWNGGVVPTIATATSVMVQHAVTVTSNFDCPSLQISGSLSIEPNASMRVVPPDGVSGYLNVTGGQFSIHGTLIGQDGITFSTSALNTQFLQGSTFKFDAGPKGYIPIASWDVASTLLITGFKNSGYVALAYSSGWRQDFGNVIYNCPLQTTFVDLNGHLRSIKGDFVVRNSNSQALRFSTTQKPKISVLGSFVVEGPSEIWLTTTSDSASILVGKDFVYNSTSTGPSYFATRGRSWISVGRNFILDSPGALRFCSGSSDSTGVRRASIQLKGDFQVKRGSLISPSPGRGKLIFAKTGTQSLVAAATAFNGVLDYFIERESTLDLGTSTVSGTGNFNVKGQIMLGSLHPQGALQISGGGNIINSGSRKFYAGARIEYNGLTGQVIGNGHPFDADIHIAINNPVGVTILNDLKVKDLSVQRGVVTTNDHQINIFGNASLVGSSSFSGKSILIFSGGSPQVFSANNHLIDQLTVSKTANSMLTLTGPVRVSNEVLIQNSSTTLNANGNLILISNADVGKTARVSPIPDDSRINGNVTFQRYMSGEGRIYRYISLPVAGASVADLQDDFPVTGFFENPSTGPGLNVKAPSLYYFNENVQDGNLGWIPFPQTGLASENYLMPGLGYAAFIRRASKPTIWDVTGTLNQGEISLPMQFTRSSDLSKRGWNLIGNPYASPIQWMKEGGWQRSEDISETIAIRDNGSGAFKYSDGEIGDVPFGIIAAGQAFWVRASAENPRLVINEEAKTNQVDEFFRHGQQKHALDYIKVQIKSRDVQDNAYLRKKIAASQDFDKHDALKRINDQLSLSIVTRDSIAVAISALDVFTCYNEFPLRLQFGSLNPIGSYSILVEAFGLFRNCKVRIKDNYNGIETDSAKYNFMITTDPASLDEERFSLIVEEVAITSNVHVRPRKHICDDPNLTIVLGNTSNSNQYFALLNGSFIEGQSFDSDSVQIVIPFPRDSKISLIIYEKTLCSINAIDSLAVYPERIPNDPVVSAIRCGEEDHLSLIKDNEDDVINVFREDQKEALCSGSNSDIWIKDSLSAFYSVSLTTQAGCKSKKVKVVPVKFGEDLQISSHNDSLHSNYVAAWYFADSLLYVDSLLSIRPTHEGEYVARTFAEGCAIGDTINYEIPDESLSYSDLLSVAPNPFTDKLAFKMRERMDFIQSITVVASDGRVITDVVGNAREILVRTDQWSSGVYIAFIQTTRGSLKIRIVK